MKSKIYCECERPLQLEPAVCRPEHVFSKGIQNQQGQTCQRCCGLIFRNKKCVE